MTTACRQGSPALGKPPEWSRDYPQHLVRSLMLRFATKKLSTAQIDKRRMQLPFFVRAVFIELSRLRTFCPELTKPARPSGDRPRQSSTAAGRAAACRERSARSALPVGGRFRKLDRTHTVLRSERANKIASGVKLFLFGHGKGRRDRHQQNIRMFVGYGGSARGQPRKL